MADVFQYRECKATITARIPDTPDADAHPDRVLVQGRGTAHPQFQGGSVVFTEIGEYAIPQPVPVVIVDGELLVEVLAGDETVTTQPLFLPVTVDERANQNWSWRLTFDFLTLGEYGEEVKHPPLSFPVEAGDGPLEISAVATPVIKTQGFITRGAPGLGISEITATDTGIQIRMEDGTTTVLDGLTRAPGTPIFPTQAEAAAWERDNPGGVAIWVDGTPDPIGPDDGLLPIWFSARTGLPPVGWTARFNTSAKTATLADGGYMRLAHNQAARWALTHDATGDVGAPLDVVMKMRGTRTSTGGFSFGIIVGQSGSGGTETGTAAYFNYGSGQSPLFRLMEYVDGTASAPLTAPAPDFTEWTWMRLHVGDDGWTRVRVWSDTEDEPDGWTQYTSLLATNPGRIGIFNAGNADADIAYFNVSTDGTPARIVGA